MMIMRQFVPAPIVRIKPLRLNAIPQIYLLLDTEPLSSFVGFTSEMQALPN